jgi:hypothetical protein
MNIKTYIQGDYFLKQPVEIINPVGKYHCLSVLNLMCFNVIRVNINS